MFTIAKHLQKHKLPCRSSLVIFVIVVNENLHSLTISFPFLIIEPFPSKSPLSVQYHVSVHRQLMVVFTVSVVLHALFWSTACKRNCPLKIKVLLYSMLLFCFCFFHSELYEKDFDGQTAIYWEVKYPFPLSNRDVSFGTQTFLIDKHTQT